MKTLLISNLEDHLGYWLRCLSNLVHHSFAARLLKHDISVEQWVVLRTVHQMPNSALNQVALTLGVDKSSLSRMVERLVRKGLLSRTEGVNRRSVELALTKEGEKLLPKLASLADENDEAFFSSLKSPDKEVFLNTIKQLLMANAWEKESGSRNSMR